MANKKKPPGQIAKVKSPCSGCCSMAWYRSEIKQNHFIKKIHKTNCSQLFTNGFLNLTICHSGPIGQLQADAVSVDKGTVQSGDHPLKCQRDQNVTFLGYFMYNMQTLHCRVGYGLIS